MLRCNAFEQIAGSEEFHNALAGAEGPVRELLDRIAVEEPIVSDEPETLRAHLMANMIGPAAQRVLAGGTSDGPEEIEADIWFNDWDRGGVLLEDARHLKQWDQTVALLWFEDEEVPPPKREHRQEDEESGLSELDGILPWPGKKRRK